jgi:hypothetical protein
MDELKRHDPHWINFYDAANQIEKRFGWSRSVARRRLRHAFIDEELLSKKAPYEISKGCFTFSKPVEHWTSTPPSQWRQSEVDYDDAESIVMVYQEQFADWLRRLKAPLAGKKLRKRKRNAASQAINAIWPKGVPDGVANNDIIKKVSDRLKQDGLTVPSPDTILRAAGRKA